MPSFLLSPLLKWSLAALGGAMVVHWAVKEARRINEELDQARRVKAKITDSENRPTLRRDPMTGEYRLINSDDIRCWISRSYRSVTPRCPPIIAPKNSKISTQPMS